MQRYGPAVIPVAIESYVGWASNPCSDYELLLRGWPRKGVAKEVGATLYIAPGDWSWAGLCSVDMEEDARKTPVHQCIAR